MIAKTLYRSCTLLLTSCVVRCLETLLTSGIELAKDALGLNLKLSRGT